MSSQNSDGWPEADRFIEGLNCLPTTDLFNPWHQYCESFDISSSAPQIRRQHLLDYFGARRCVARYLLIGEALSFEGGRFSGIAMTSERMLNNQQPDIVRAGQIVPDLDPQNDSSWRTSKPSACSSREARAHGRIEITSTVVWHVARDKLGLDPFEFVLWNAVPWHPYKLDGDIPKNRPPRQRELEVGRARLLDFLGLFPAATPVPIGKVAELELYRLLNSDTSLIPHPANANVEQFTTEICDRFERLRSRSGGTPCVAEVD